MADMAYQVFVDLDATALEGGAIYLGVPNDDPELNPIPVYWDAALTVLATQPLRTSGGVIVRDGTPSDVYASVPGYSIRVRNRAGKVVWYKSTTGGSSASRLSFPIPSGPPGEQGIPGNADNTYSSYAAMQASDPTRRSARLVGDTDTPPHPDGPYNNPTQTIGGWVPQTAAGVNFDGRNTDAKLRENVATTDARFAGGANAVGAADATAAFNAAKAASLAVSTPGQRFILNNLPLDRDYQRWELGGAVWSKAAAAPVTTITGRGVKITGGDIDGGGGSTDNIIINGQEAEIRVMSNRATTGRAILAINANATVIFGGIHKTEDTTGSGYDIEFRNTGAGSLYNKIIGTATNQNTGGTLLNGAGASHILGNQMGKLTTLNGGGGFIVANRIGGTLNVQSSSINLEANNFAQDLVFGTDNQPNIGNIGLGPTCFGQTGKTIDIANNVRESQLFLDQFVHPTTTINIRSPQNAIYLREQAVSLGLGAASGSPTFGNGTVKTQCAYMGWQRKLTGSVTFGSTTNFGGGNAFYFVAPFKAKTTALGTAFATDAGTGFYSFICRMLEGSDQIFFFPTSSGSAVGNPASATSPFTWATDDSLVFEILFEQMAS